MIGLWIFSSWAKLEKKVPQVFHITNVRTRERKKPMFEIVRRFAI